MPRSTAKRASVWLGSIPEWPGVVGDWMTIEGAVPYRCAHVGDGAKSQGASEVAGGARGASVMIGGLLLRPRQVDVIWLLMRGMSRTEIAERLGVAGNTVDYHLTDLRERLGVDTSRMVIAWAAGYQAELSVAYAGMRRAGQGSKERDSMS